MNSHTVDVQPFDYNSIPRDGLIQISGKRGSGKTSWCRYILSKLSDKHEGLFVVMTPSAKVKASWCDMVPRLYIVEPSIEYLELLRDTQNAHIQCCDQLGIPFPSALHVTLILDDCASIRKLMASPIMAWLASNGRHLHLRMIVTVQYFNQLTAEVRTQFDVVFVLATSNRRNITKLHEELVGCGDVRLFRHVVASMTLNRGALVIDNNKNSADINDCCFHAKATSLMPAVRLGAPKLWDFSDTHYYDYAVPGRTQRSNLQDILHGEAEEDDDDDVTLHNNRLVVNDRLGRIVIRKVG
jgi:hypothetical protein